MKEDIGLTSEQLEIVFDTLDTDKNGYLTIDQFLKGFSKLIKIQILLFTKSQSDIMLYLDNGTII